MPYIIDGHNLIAAMPGIKLDDLDDERVLIEQLQSLARREARRIFVYFDQGQTGRRNDFKLGRVQVRFAKPPRTADEAISSHLRAIGAEGPNWVVVSSDREVQRQARHVRARTLSSDEFINQIMVHPEPPEAGEKPQHPISADEIEAWEALFSEDDDET